MKNLAVTLLLITMPFINMAQQTIEYTITHDGLEREYILYVPASYTGSDAVSLLFNFHGFGGNANDQMQWGDFRPIADSAGFLIAHPQGTDNNGVAFWNIGQDTTAVDDIGFTEAMIDSIGAEYNIDPDRVYATGKSLGGFFSIHLAGQLSDKIAAIASVSGTMTQGMYDNMSPVHPTPFLHIHGTGDPLVPYDGNQAYLPVSDVLDYWIDYNNCNMSPIVTQLPDIDPNDGSTVERYVYEGGDNGVHVEHLKVFGGGHSWPGSDDPYPGTNYDINGSEEIWNFLSRYDINGLIEEPFGIEPIYGNQTPENIIRVYPNPFRDEIYIEGVEGNEVYTLSNILGHVIYRGENISEVDLNQVNSGMYLLNISSGNHSQTVKLIKN